MFATMMPSECDGTMTMGSSMMMGRVPSGVERTEKELDAFARVERIYRLSNTPQPTRPLGDSNSNGTNNNNYTNTKHHKQKKPRKNIPVDFSEYPALVDFSHLERLAPDLRSRVRLVEPKRVINSKYFGDIKEIYTFDDHKGFYVIPNPFTPEQQRYWVRRCVRELTVGNPTNVSNLDGNATLWSEWKPEYMRTLRWTSVGYHFQWTERVYRDDKRGPFPPDMREVVRDLAAVIGIDMVAEAAIINYYPRENCVMGGHVDDSEEDMTKPVVSLSFGNSIVFCIGETHRNVEPTAILVRSGDVVIMSGHSRYCYHSVPRMFAKTCPTYLSEKQGEEEDSTWTPVREYIANARVNMNCRQVKIMPRDLDSQ